jgi:hypothetical protein
MLAVPSLRMPPPVLVTDYARASGRGETLQTLKSLKSLEVRAQRPVLQRRDWHVSGTIADIHDLEKSSGIHQ